MKTYTLFNFRINDKIFFEADNDEMAYEICKREMNKRRWLQEDCTCWDDASSYDDYKWEDAK